MYASIRTPAHLDAVVVACTVQLNVALACTMRDEHDHLRDLDDLQMFIMTCDDAMRTSLFTLPFFRLNPFKF